MLVRACMAAFWTVHAIFGPSCRALSWDMSMGCLGHAAESVFAHCHVGGGLVFVHNMLESIFSE